MQDPKQILLELEKLDARIKTALEKIIGRNPSKEQMLQFLASDEFDKFIDEMGLRKAVGQYITGFDVGFGADFRALSGFAGVDLTAQQIQRISTNLDLLKNSFGRTVLGYAMANKDLLRSRLISSIINGVTAADTIKSLEGQLISTLTETPLTTPQLGTVVNTSYADYSRATTAEVFKDKPEQRFYYQAGIPADAPQKSKICKWLIENQKSEGYTKAEIDAGIVTPFGIVDFQGRQPNYNCTDAWYPL